jgi:hypothetical protein
MLATVFALTVPMFAMSCSDNEPDTFTQEDFPLCAANTTRLIGTIDDVPVDVTLPGGTGGLSQDNEGGDYYYQGQPDPTQPDLRVVWYELLGFDRTAPATGTFRLVDGPFANESFCAGEGSVALIPRDETRAVVQFGFTSLRSGANCEVPHTGQLVGCVQY